MGAVKNVHWYLCITYNIRFQKSQPLVQTNSIQGRDRTVRKVFSIKKVNQTIHTLNLQHQRHKHVFRQTGGKSIRIDDLVLKGLTGFVSDLDNEFCYQTIESLNRHSVYTDLKQNNKEVVAMRHTSSDAWWCHQNLKNGESKQNLKNGESKQNPFSQMKLIFFSWV